MPDLIRTTEAVKKDELRKIVRITNGVAVDEHGELIPGVAVSPALTKFTLEVDGVKFGGIEVDLSPAPKAEVEVEPGEEAGAA
jgi:hypothetical protein